ncbi:MAG: L,D-transpeptidase [Verrucomicrobiales bacterium]|nr:L,D-transpeptidase [Verrucomicrobiales bacterium]
MNPNRSYTLLMPLASLPAEGRELLPFNSGGSSSTHLRSLVDVCESGPRILMGTRETENPGRLDLALATLSSDGLIVHPTVINVDWNRVAESLPRHDIYEGEEVEAASEAREAARLISSAMSDTLGALRGRPLALMRSSQVAEGKCLEFLGFWLADGDEVIDLGGNEEGWVLDEPDVEGHGIKEMAAAIVLGLCLLPSSGSAQDQAPAKKGFFRQIFSSKSEHKESSSHSKADIIKVNDAQAPAVLYKDVLYGASGGESRVVVDLSGQRAYLYKGNQIALDTPISTGRFAGSTPLGTFKITQRVREGKMSTLYNCPLPFWMRLDEMPVGMHIGDIPGHPASHGCIRLPKQVAQHMFDGTGSGTTVQVVSNWDPSAVPMLAGN